MITFIPRVLMITQVSVVTQNGEGCTERQFDNTGKITT